MLTLQEYHRVRNHLEDKYTKVRLPCGKFAETIFNKNGPTISTLFREEDDINPRGGIAHVDE